MRVHAILCDLALFDPFVLLHLIAHDTWLRLVQYTQDISWRLL